MGAGGGACSLLGVPGTATGGGGIREAAVVVAGTETTTRYSPPYRNKSNVSVVHSMLSGALMVATS